MTPRRHDPARPVGDERRGPFALRFAIGIAIAACLGWALTTVQPVVPNVAVLILIGLAIAFALHLSVLNLTLKHARRSTLVSAMVPAFLTIQWGTWAFSAFEEFEPRDVGGTAHSDEEYSPLSMGLPLEVDPLMMMVSVVGSMLIMLPTIVIPFVFSEDSARRDATGTRGFFSFIHWT